jgi:Polyketide cyclase / dehydrase and lipid transport
MPPVEVTTDVQIGRPRAEVAAYAADPENATTWYENIVSSRWASAPPLAVGSRIEFVARFLGRRMAYTYVVSDYEPGAHLVMRTDEGPFPMQTTYRWDDAEGGTRMTLRNRGEPSGFAKIASPMMVSAMRRANRKDLDRLRGILEG